jgi:putative NADH-flavin reductase
MRVLLLGGTGKLGSRLIPALLGRGHSVVALVRSQQKLRGLLTTDLFSKITIVEGDALSSENIETALGIQNCDALIHAAGGKRNERLQGPIAQAASDAAVKVGKERGSPLRAWIIGGLGTLEYPGTGGWKIHDYMPLWTTQHHKDTEAVITAIPTHDLKWTLHCVAMMYPESDETESEKKPIDILERPRGHHLVVEADQPPAYRDSWVRWVPILGVYLNIVPLVRSYGTVLEEVAGAIAEEIGEEGDAWVGRVVGMKAVEGGREKLVGVHT